MGGEGQVSRKSATQYHREGLREKYWGMKLSIVRGKRRVPPFTQKFE